MGTDFPCLLISPRPSSRTDLRRLPGMDSSLTRNQVSRGSGLPERTFLGQTRGFPGLVGNETAAALQGPTRRRPSISADKPRKHRDPQVLSNLHRRIWSLSALAKLCPRPPHSAWTKASPMAQVQEVRAGTCTRQLWFLQQPSGRSTI